MAGGMSGQRAHPGDLLTVTVTVAATQALLFVRGEVDFFSVPELYDALDAIIEAGHGEVTLDLSELAFIDASGLRVIAAAANRLGELGRGLALRSPSTMVQRMLDVTGLADLMSPDQPEAIRLS
jgi:anti-sigma B factor antagonist